MLTVTELVVCAVCLTVTAAKTETEPAKVSRMLRNNVVKSFFCFDFILFSFPKKKRFLKYIRIILTSKNCCVNYYRGTDIRMDTLRFINWIMENSEKIVKF